MTKDLKIKNWVAGGLTALAAAVGLGIGLARDPLDGHEPVKVKDARYDQRAGSIKTDSIQAFSAPAAASSNVAKNPVSAAVQAAPEDKRNQSEVFRDLSKLSFKKFQMETLSPIKRFNHIYDAYKYIGKDINKVEETLGISPYEMVMHLRQAGYEAIRDYQTQAQPGTDLEKLMQAKEILAAAAYAQIQANGEIPSTRENVAGVDIAQLEAYKTALVGPAALEAMEKLKSIPSIEGMGNKDLLQYWDMLDLAVYAIEYGPVGQNMDRNGRKIRHVYTGLTADIENQLLKNQQAESLTVAGSLPAPQTGPNAPKP